MPSVFPKDLTLKADNPALDRMFGRIQLFFEKIAGQVILDGRYVDEVNLTSGVQNFIEHKLGRAVKGYIVVKNNAQCDIWDNEATNTNQDRFLVLRTSANAIVSLWIF
jgi:hypothetical protein